LPPVSGSNHRVVVQPFTPHRSRGNVHSIYAEVDGSMLLIGRGASWADAIVFGPRQSGGHWRVVAKHVVDWREEGAHRKHHSLSS
jgi:hypothetical protein